MQNPSLGLIRANIYCVKRRANRPPIGAGVVRVLDSEGVLVAKIKPSKKKKANKAKKRRELSKARADDLRTRATPAELFLLGKLRDAGIRCEFQPAIHWRQTFFIADIYIKRIRLCIEVDGGYHESEDQKQKDRYRDNCLKKAGIETLRFKNSEVMEDPERIVTLVLGRINGHDAKYSEVGNGPTFC
jgi:leucyl-tRNA synthetase